MPDWSQVIKNIINLCCSKCCPAKENLNKQIRCPSEKHFKYIRCIKYYNILYILFGLFVSVEAKRNIYLYICVQKLFVKGKCADNHKILYHEGCIITLVTVEDYFVFFYFWFFHNIHFMICSTINNWTSDCVKIIIKEVKEIKEIKLKIYQN